MATKTLVLAAQKGGSGKSTLAVHLAVMAQAQGRTILVDTDPQQSVTAWAKLRDADSPAIYTVAATDIPELVSSARADGVEYVIVDTAPHATASLSHVLRSADLVVIPVRPTMFDLQSLEATHRMVTASGRPGVVVLSQVPANKTETAVADELAGDVEGMGLAVSPVRVRQRPAYSRALLEGLAVTEYRRGAKHAREEVHALWDWLTSRVSR